MPRTRTVFVSCGQLTEAEKRLGTQVGEIIRAKGLTPFFADEVHSAGALNTVVFDALRTCGAFIGILHQRGAVTFRPYRRSVRSSVWIQQEIAIFCYRMFANQSVLPIRVYSQRGIRLEGVMSAAIVNPIEFDEPATVLTDVGAWLDGAEFETHPIQLLREELFHEYIADLDVYDLRFLELVMAYCASPDDGVPSHVVRDRLYREFRATGISDTSVMDQRCGRAEANLTGRGFIVSKPSGITVAKQWWQLILDELRDRGGVRP